MNFRSNNRRTAAAALIAALMLFGCDKNNPADAAATSDVTNDAAYLISGAVGDESGGMTESVGDMLTVQSLGRIDAGMTLAKTADETVTADSGTYDPASGWWTISISRTRSNARVSASIQRTYTYRFWKNDAEWQQYYVTGPDTAVKMEFTIVSGSGSFRNPHVSHTLNRLEGSWVAENINTDTVTITLQQNYVREAVDSIVTYRATRSFAHTLTITAATITTVRFKPNGSRTFADWRANLSHAIGGTVTGHISSTITVVKGENTNERSIEKDFTVTFNGGTGSIDIPGAGKRFNCDMRYGDM